MAGDSVAHNVFEFLSGHLRVNPAVILASGLAAARPPADDNAPILWLSTDTGDLQTTYGGTSWSTITVDNALAVLADITDVTSTAAEVNQLHSQGAVTTDFAKLHALTASAAEVNQLTAQGAVTTDFAKLHALTATAAEINVLHSVTAGAAAASSAVVLDANKAVSGQADPVLTKAVTYPLTAADSGSRVITNPSGADIVLTLPAPAAGLKYRVFQKGTSGSVGLTIATNGSEKVFAKGITASAGKGLINTHATEAQGDAVDIFSDGTDWYAVLTGTWARVA